MHTPTPAKSRVVIPTKQQPEDEAEDKAEERATSFVVHRSSLAPKTIIIHHLAKISICRAARKPYKNRCFISKHHKHTKN
jgi:hypothetical protein